MTASPRGPRERIPVAVLGATGAVGQTFIRLLARHPWLRLAEVAASERSAGRSFGDAARWLLEETPPNVVAMPVLPCSPDAVSAPLVFSALDASAAGPIEEAFARDGRIVLSNARNFRMERDVPLLIPEINPDHLALLDWQREQRGWSGGIVTNANCAAIVIAMALAPLHRAFGVRQLFVTTMQAVSGAGYPGVPSLDILGNVIPFIRDEEEKIESETRKILGDLGARGVTSAAFGVSAQANRVAVEDGHTACISVALERPTDPDGAIAALRGWSGAISELGLPSAPVPPLVVHEASDRPQPRRDAGRGGGMAVVVGRVRRDPLLDLRLVACGHNMVRGAAGASILNAELMIARGLVPGA
ncbi:MAG: aspartate-semialdehyde dehydrogenase [Gemmatimonadota bacterium]|nr:aspartate-semialdehyde dehydrogenase [Gemmatimonadota bacterium]